MAGDLNGDGVNDLFIGAPSQSVRDQPGAGRVYAVSGRALAEGRAGVLWTVDPPSPAPGAGFGFALAPLPRAGHAEADLAIGAAEGEQVWLVRGATGEVTRTLSGPASRGAGSGFGSRLGVVDDLDGDGFSELLVGAPRRYGGSGAAYLFRGATGDLLRELRLPSPDARAGEAPRFGASVQGVGDADGDGMPDLLVGAPGHDGGRGRLYLFSGGTGGLLSVLDSPEPQPGSYFGFQDVAASSPGDVDGDGLAEVYGCGFLQAGTSGPAEGAAWVLDPRSGLVRCRLAPPRPCVGGQFGWSMTAADHTGGRGADLYVGAAPHHPSSRGQGGTWIFRGADGALLAELGLPEEWRQPATATSLGPNLGWSVAAPGDLSGSGAPDYVAGAPFTNVDGSRDEGMVFVFRSEARILDSSPGPPAPGRPPEG